MIVPTSSGSTSAAIFDITGMGSIKNVPMGHVDDVPMGSVSSVPMPTGMSVPMPTGGTVPMPNPAGTPMGWVPDVPMGSVNMPGMPCLNLPSYNFFCGVQGGVNNMLCAPTIPAAPSVPSFAGASPFFNAFMSGSAGSFFGCMGGLFG
jgi:hypothetical protein